MKTAEEWSREYWKLKQNPPPRVKSKTPSMHEWDILIQQIQLDAMKEGMRRAAKMCNDQWSHMEIPAERLQVFYAEKGILSAAKQLTEKDLCN